MLTGVIIFQDTEKNPIELSLNRGVSKLERCSFSNKKMSPFSVFCT